MFPLKAFTSDIVARLTGLSIDQLHRWDRNGFFSPSLADPNRRRPNSRVYSFRDVVGLRTIAKLRDRGVSFSDLREIRDVLGQASLDWSGRTFSTVGNRVYTSQQDAMLAARRLGQGVTPQTLDLAEIGSEMEIAVGNLSNRRDDEIGKVSQDRQILGGVPVIAGTRIPTETIAWFVREGYNPTAIRREFPRLTDCDIEAAVEFEESRIGSLRAAS